jgi:DNA-binding CsgD family transcriptional regulator
VLARAARLGGGSREVLDVAALIGARIELDLLRSVRACSPQVVDEILVSGLLAEDGGWLRFRHEIARLAVEQAIPSHRRGVRLGIRSIPAGPRTATRGDPLGLTRREREVLELICAGHTNAEIAAKLFLSARTVDHHVSAVLAKLGAPTRGAAASHAARLGLVGRAER